VFLSFGRLARFQLADWSNSGQCRKRLIWLEMRTELLSDLAIGRLSDFKSLNDPMARSLNLLLAVQLDDQLLINRQLNVLALGQR
jgi:hypothetical protein